MSPRQHPATVWYRLVYKPQDRNLINTDSSNEQLFIDNSAQNEEVDLKNILRKTGRALGRFLNQSTRVDSTSPPSDPALLMRLLRPSDVLLIEGTSRVSKAIKYLTQSTWSHAALFVGDAQPLPGDPRQYRFVESDTVEGVRVVDIDHYTGLHTRICRPVNLPESEREAIVRYACDRIGSTYDLKNIFDLARYLFPTPPVPVRWRRRMLAFGSGDPTRAICSTLIAQAFQSVRYPILPIIETLPSGSEILHIRHHSLFVPRDFDVSPYFEIIKPTLSPDFDHHKLLWNEKSEAV